MWFPVSRADLRQQDIETVYLEITSHAAGGRDPARVEVSGRERNGESGWCAAAIFAFAECGGRSTLLTMAASMYIVVEGEDPGFDIFVNGRALARHEDALERLALKLGVRPLIEFFSADENSMALLIEEGGGNPELMRRLPPPQWYAADDGLATVLALVAALQDDPQLLGTEGPQVLSELEEYARVLERTVKAGLRWHLAVSWR